MSHATIHATLAARDVLTIPSPPWRSRIVSTRGRLRFRGRADYWQKYHSRSWKTARGRRRLGFPVQRAHSRDDVGTAVPAQGQRNRKADSIINAVGPWRCRLARVYFLERPWASSSRATKRSAQPFMTDFALPYD